jgi:anti-sigma28 factor (negative regulator of flagellin synthesis)
MRIGENSTPRPVDPADSKVQNASPAPASSTKRGVAPVSAGSSDVVEVGPGKGLLQLAFQLSAVSREHRVEEIRQRLVSGDYHVSSEEVSRAIVEDMVSRGFPGAATG